MPRNYDSLFPISADCCVATIEAALNQIGEEAKHVSSDVYVSDRWTPGEQSSIVTKPNSPYDFDTNDIAADIAREIDVDYRYKGGLSRAELAALIEKKLDEMLQDGKIRIFQKNHHIPP